MIPVLIGAAAVGVAGAAILSGDDKSAQPSESGRQLVSESKVEKAMARSGRKIQSVSQEIIAQAYEPTLEVFESVQQIIVKQLGIDADEVEMNSLIVKNLGADSLDVVEMILSVEEEFNIEIPDEQAEKMETVGDVVRYVLRN